MSAASGAGRHAAQHEDGTGESDEEQHRGEADAAAGADPEQFRTCHRIGGDALHQRAGGGEHDTGRTGRHQPWPAECQQLAEQVSGGDAPAVRPAPDEQGKGDQRDCHQEQWSGIARAWLQHCQRRDEVRGRPVSGAHARQQPQQQRPAEQRGGGAGRREVGEAGAGKLHHAVGDGEHDGAGNRRDQQDLARRARADEPGEGRRREPDEADDADLRRHRGGEPDGEQHDHQPRRQQADAEAARAGIVEAENGERAHQQKRGHRSGSEPGGDGDRRVPALQAERAGAPDVERHQILAAGEHDEGTERRRDHRDHHAGQHDDDRIEPALPDERQHARRGGGASGERHALARDGDQCRRQGHGQRQRELRAGGDAERRGIGDRIAQHPLQQRAGKPERGAAEQRGRGAGQQGVQQQDAVEHRRIRTRQRRPRRQHRGEQREGKEAEPGPGPQQAQRGADVSQGHGPSRRAPRPAAGRSAPWPAAHRTD